jgi:hypothetical protein
LQAADIDGYGAKVAAYNRMVRGATPLDAPLPRYLAVLKSMTGTSWPDDFIVIVGTYETDECAGEDGRWLFGYNARAIELEAILVENASDESMVIDGVLGSRSSQEGLRQAGGSPSADTIAAQVATTLAPRKRLLVPIAIRFPAPTDDSLMQPADDTPAIQRKLGTMGFTGNVGGLRRLPAKDFVFGPEIKPTGLQVGGRKIEFVRRTANFLDLTASAEIGSCPYLLSWSDDDEEWMEHGKVLHEGLGPEHEYTETITFSDFRSHYRLEEREAEMPHETTRTRTQTP